MNTMQTTTTTAKNAWVSVFMETQKLPVVDAKIPDQLDERK